MQWEKLSDDEKDRFGYERALRAVLEDMMDDLRRKIQRNESRLKQQAVPSLPSAEQVRHVFRRLLLRSSLVHHRLLNSCMQKNSQSLF